MDSGARRILTGLFAVSLLFAIWTKRHAPVHKSFLISRPLLSGSMVTTSRWIESSVEIPRKATTFVIVASWCRYSKDFLDKMQHDRELRNSIDAALLYEDEASAFVDSRERDHTITNDEAALLRERFAGQVLVDPSVISGYQIPFYFIRKGQFRDILTGYPMIVDCGLDSCTPRSEE